MTIVNDLLKDNTIKRTWIDRDGVILAEATMQPSVLPMYQMDFRDQDPPIYVQSRRKIWQYPKGTFFRLLAISAKGTCVLKSVENEQKWGNGALHETAAPMEALVLMVHAEVELPSPSKLTDTIPADKPKK